MITRIVSGGQTGGDQAAWRAAKRLGIETGGWMPSGFRTEEGPRPDLGRIYGAQENGFPGYRERTEDNVGDSDITLWLGSAGGSAGFSCTKRATERFGKTLVIVPDLDSSPEVAARHLEGFSVINVAGNRESRNPGIGAKAEEWLVMMLALTQLV